MRPRVRLDVVDLDLFVNIANCESLTAGAERSSMSAGAASARIRNLEDSLGTPLLVRSRRGMTLTLAGRIFDQYAREVLGHTTRAVEEIGRFRENSGHVRVGANVVATSRFLASTLGTFLSAHPGVSLTLHEGLSSDIVRSVRDGALDIGIVAGAVSVSGTLSVPLCSERMVIAVGAGHALAGTQAVSFQDTLDYDYVSLGATSANFLFLLEKAEEIQRVVRIRAEVGGFESLCAMVEAGTGIGLVPQSIAEQQRETYAIRICDLSDKWATRTMNICASQSLSPKSVAGKLFAFLRQRYLDR